MAASTTGDRIIGRSCSKSSFALGALAAGGTMQNRQSLKAVD